MMLTLLLAALAAAPSAPTPLQYYSQALATMQRVPEPAYVSFDTSLTVRGLGMATPCDKGKIQWDFSVRSGYRGQLYHQLTWHAVYASANDHEVIRTMTGDTCRGPAETFDRPTWQDAYDWVRYGILSQAPSSAATQTGRVRSSTTLKTIADVSVIAPCAYRVSDGGPQRCPSGSPGHELHFAPRFDSAKHPLRDAVVESQSMRICMIRFDLGSYQAAGTGYRGDMQIDFGDVGGNWIITRGHAALALRAVGISLKTVTFDFSYSNVAFPALSS